MKCKVYKVAADGVKKRAVAFAVSAKDFGFFFEKLSSILGIIEFVFHFHLFEVIFLPMRPRIVYVLMVASSRTRQIYWLLPSSVPACKLIGN